MQGQLSRQSEGRIALRGIAAMIALAVICKPGKKDVASRHGLWLRILVEVVEEVHGSRALVVLGESGGLHPRQTSITRRICPGQISNSLMSEPLRIQSFFS